MSAPRFKHTGPRRFLLVCHLPRSGLNYVIGKYRTMEAARQARDAYSTRDPWDKLDMTIKDDLSRQSSPNPDPS